MAETIYFDTCALNRLTDDLSQVRVREEAKAVADTLELVARRKVHWVASSVLMDEIASDPNLARRTAATVVISTAHEFVRPTADTLRSAAALEIHGLAGVDALHLATAQQAHVDFLLTTDDRFLRRAARALLGITVHVINPVNWWNRRRPWVLPHSSVK